MKSMTTGQVIPCLLAGAGLLCSASAASAQDRSQGIMAPIVFAPFNPDATVCAAPADLTRVLAFARDNDRDLMTGVDLGLSQAARDRNLEYRWSVADNDPVRVTTQVDDFRANHVGALVAAPLDPASLAPLLQKMIWSGA